MLPLLLSLVLPFVEEHIFYITLHCYYFWLFNQPIFLEIIVGNNINKIIIIKFLQRHMVVTSEVLAVSRISAQ